MCVFLPGVLLQIVAMVRNTQFGVEDKEKKENKEEGGGHRRPETK